VLRTPAPKAAERRRGSSVMRVPAGRLLPSGWARRRSAEPAL
jgi:hypothetical protein